MKRALNFSAGPSTLPEPVLKIAAEEMLDYHRSGQSVMEMSHRSKVFGDIIKGAESALRELLEIPDDYHVLFLQGGASTQFAMVPLNLMSRYRRAEFIITGQWASKAQKEAARYGDARIVASSEDQMFSYIPELNSDHFSDESDYVHICLNNTIYGTTFHEIPNTGRVPLVADASSYILSEPMDVSKFGLIYAGAQKNMGPAGVTIVVVRKDLVGSALDITPTMLHYQTHADSASLYNTPPCYAIYICKLVFEWILHDMGGLEGIRAYNLEKATLLYDFLDHSKLFHGTVRKKDRSLMNIPFVTGNAQLDAEFIEEAEKALIVNIKGHRSVGGMRASIYNAMPMEGVQTLVEFMKDFERKHS